MLNLTPLQWIGIVLVVNGAVIGSTAQLTDLFGAHAAHLLISIASLGNSILGGLNMMFGGQGAQVKNVLAMPGVEKITVNSQVNSTLAAIAVDPAQEKIEPTAASESTVANIARGA